jgi:hypothetical protein
MPASLGAQRALMDLITSRAEARAWLGLPEDGPLARADVRRAFKLRSLTAHPDKPGGSEADFHATEAARQVLLDEIEGIPPTAAAAAASAAATAAATATMAAAAAAAAEMGGTPEAQQEALMSLFSELAELQNQGSDLVLEMSDAVACVVSYLAPTTPRTARAGLVLYGPPGAPLTGHAMPCAAALQAVPGAGRAGPQDLLPHSLAANCAPSPCPHSRLCRRRRRGHNKGG